MHRGYIKVWRKLLTSKTYRPLKASQRDVLISCLLMANHTENSWEWKGDVINLKPGQFVTSLDSIQSVCAPDTSIRNIRTALKKLEKYKFLTNKSTKTGRVITILNWDFYQAREPATDKESDKEVTKYRQRSDKEVTTNKNDKNDKEDISKDISLSRNSVPYSEIIGYLNQQAGRRFRSDSPKTRTLIKTLWNRNYRLKDFQRVVDNKVADWLNHPKYSKFLRPETLFGPKFEGYLNEPQNTLAGVVSEKTVKTIQNLKSLELD